MTAEASWLAPDSVSLCENWNTYFQFRPPMSCDGDTTRTSFIFVASRFLFFLLVVSKPDVARCLSETNPPFQDRSRRNLLWKLPVGAAGMYVYGRLLYNAFAVHDLRYPEAHESRVTSTIATAVVESSLSKSKMTPAPAAIPWTSTFRVLEVGIGNDCRLIRRGLYTPGLEALGRRKSGDVQRVEITGVDLHSVERRTVDQARQTLKDETQNMNLQVDLQFVAHSITSRLDYPDGYFDCILCSLTLCSVDDQDRALDEVLRLLRPNGGTFGYVEHVAVDPDEPYRFLELQQTVLDLLQQRLAENCHLHRYTERAIATAFESKGSTLLQHERFLVNNMWPVTCQCCGVYQRNS